MSSGSSPRPSASTPRSRSWGAARAGPHGAASGRRNRARHGDGQLRLAVVRRRAASHPGDRRRARRVPPRRTAGRADHHQGVSGALRHVLARASRSSSGGSSSPRSNARSTRGRAVVPGASPDDPRARCATRGSSAIDARTYLIERRAPLDDADRDYIQKTVFDRNWGERLRPALTREDWALRDHLCDPESPRNVLRSAGYHCLYPITVFGARVPKWRHAS